MIDRPWSILLVDDDPDDYMLTRAMFVEAKGQSIVLEWANTYDAAVAALDAGDYDAILVDYDLGARNGVEFVRETQLRGLQMPVIMLTGRGNYEVDLEAMQAGASDYLSKSFVTAPMLERTVRYAIERKQAELALRRVHEELEQRVREKTQQLQRMNEKLAEANRQLQAENEERLRVEELLRKSNKALQEGKSRLAMILEQLPAVLWTTDRRLRITYSRGKGLAALGLKPDEAVGQDLRDFARRLLPHSRAQEAHEQALRGEVIKYVEEIKGHSYQVHLQPLRSADGRIMGCLGIALDTTEQVRAQARVAYQAYLLENVSDAVVASDENLTITAWNRAAEAIYGWKAVEAIGRSEPDLLRTEAIGLDPAQRLRRMYETGSFSGELIHYRKDGRPIYVETKVIALRDRSGKIMGYAAVNRDITERKRSEEQIRRYTARTKALSDLSRRLAETRAEADHIYQELPRWVAELTGEACALTLLSADRRRFEKVSHAHPLPEAEAGFGRVLSTAGRGLEVGRRGQVVRTGKPLLVPVMDQPPTNGREKGPQGEGHRVCSLLIVPLKVQGEVIGTLGISRDQEGDPYQEEDQVFLQEVADRAALAIANARLFAAGQTEIAERRRVEALLRESNTALQENEARFRTVFQESALGIALKDLDGRILAGNPALQEMLGYTGEELQGMRFTDLTHPGDVVEEKVLLSRLSAGAIRRYRLEKRYLHKDGSLIWARVAVSVVEDERGKPLFAIFLVENITDWKRIQAELAELRRRLLDSREAERLELSRELHDGPMQELYAIAYQMTDLQEQFSEAGPIPGVTDEGSPAVEQLKNTQQRIFQIIQELRVFSMELRPPTLTPFGLERTIQSHAETFKEQHPDLNLVLELQPDGQTLPEQIRLALYRIYQVALSNVLRHAQASRAHVRFRFDAELAHLEVQDDGIGFSVPTWIELAREGHLGLAGAAERAEALGGRVEVDSAPGQGTVVRVVIPWGN